MKIAGIIAEYNPFHNGHLYHISQTRAKTGADKVICVMSGSFVQRGEPAFMNKFARARAALECGADMIIELPVVFSLQSAQYFALAGVRILDALRVCDIISFGREGEELPEKREDMRVRLDKGLSFPASVYNSALPNDVLAAEYINALKNINSSMRPFWIKRTGAHDGAHPRQSALGIRNAVRAGNIAELNGAMPRAGLNILKEQLDAMRAPWQEDALFRLVCSRVRSASCEELGEIMGADEGLEYRLKRAADRAAGLEELMDLIKTKRYTRARLSRYLMCTLLNITKRQIQAANDNIPYIRCLGVRSESKELLGLCADSAVIPFFTSGIQLKKTGCELFQIEMRGTDLYELLTYKPGPGGRDMTEGLIVV